MQEWLTKNHSIATADGYRVETVSINPEYHYEWQFVSPTGKVIYRSQHGYGNPLAAVKDGLFIVLGEPSLGNDRIEIIREEIREKIQTN